jgi:glutamine amidotransferase
MGTTDYGMTYASICGRDNIVGVQFHPEKSQATGLKLLQNFAEM